MRKILALFIVAATHAHAHAGIIGDLCQKFLLANSVPDPTQYQNCDTDWLIGEYRKLNIRAAWGRIGHADAQDLIVIRQTLETRMQYGVNDAAEADQILAALKE